MDAKSKANFINSVAAGESIPCPKCGNSNTADSKFCVFCGEKFVSSDKEGVSAPAFGSVNETEPAKESAPAFGAVAETEAPANEAIPVQAQPAKVERYVEPSNVFAQGLPEWNIEPPQVMVRRR